MTLSQNRAAMDSVKSLKKKLNIPVIAALRQGGNVSALPDNFLEGWDM